MCNIQYVHSLHKLCCIYVRMYTNIFTYACTIYVPYLISCKQVDVSVESIDSSITSQSLTKLVLLSL